MKFYVKSILVSLVVAGVVAFTSQAAVAQKSSLIFYSSLTTAAAGHIGEGHRKEIPGHQGAVHHRRRRQFVSAFRGRAFGG